MAVDWVSKLDFSQPAVLAPVAIGVVFTLGVFRLFWRQTGRGKPTLPPPAEDRLGQDPFIFGSAQEQRAAPRRRGNPVDVLISDAMGKAIPSHGTVLDRSVGGLRLLVTNPLTEGKIYSVRPVKGNVVTPWI